MIDNVSVRELYGNHAIQATAAAKPLYQTTPTRLTLDRVDDRLVMNVPPGGFVGTMVLSTPEGTAAYGVNIPAELAVITVETVTVNMGEAAALIT